MQSRYYDAVTGRFVSPDAFISTGQGFAGYNMYAYCNNNPVMYIDYTGESFGVFLALAIVAIIVVSLTGCKNNEEQDVTTEELCNRTTITPLPDKITEESISVSLNLDDIYNLSNDNEKLIEYTNVLADDIEADYKDYLGENKVDRVQLYSEIKSHVVCWDLGILVDNANPANINIYSDGSVVDHRPWVNKYALKLFGDEYHD